MKFTFGSDISGVSFFARMVVAEENIFSVHLNSCHPWFFSLLWHELNSQITMTTIALSSAYVLYILRLSSFSKIINAIVRRISVLMIQPCYWPRTSFIKPRQSMGKIKTVIRPDMDISLIVIASGLFANFDAIRRAFNPSKYASCSIVMQQLSKSFLCDTWGNHLYTSFVNLVRSPMSVSALLGFVIIILGL